MHESADVSDTAWAVVLVCADTVICGGTIARETGVGTRARARLAGPFEVLELGNRGCGNAVLVSSNQLGSGGLFDGVLHFEGECQTQEE